MKVLLFGKGGQVGWELQRSLAPLGELIALDVDSQQQCGDFTRLDDIAKTMRAAKRKKAIAAQSFGLPDCPDLANLRWHMLLRNLYISTAAETQGLVVSVAVVTVGFATRNLFDYMFAGSLAHLFWILVAAGLCSVTPQISTETGAGDLSLNEIARNEH